MSVEKIFDKLDEKISSLLRNLGLIITVLFGFTAIIYNIFGLNLMVIIIMIILFSCFLGNFIYSLNIYIIKSSKIHDFLYKIQLYEEIKELCGDIFFKSLYHLLNIREIYIKIIKTSNTQEGILNLIDRVKDRFEYWKCYDSETEECKLETTNIADHQKVIRLFIEIFLAIKIAIKERPIEVQVVLFKRGLKEKEKKEQEKDRNIMIVQEFVEKLQDYISKIAKFRDMKLIKNIGVYFDLEGTVITPFMDYLNGFYKIIEETYLENLREIDKEKIKYQKSISKCYILYGITISSSVIIFLGVLITIANF